MDTKLILEEALSLRPAERLKLIEMLTRSLNNPDESIEKIWAEESEKRYNALIEGKVKTIAFKEIIERYKQMQVEFIEPASIELDDAIEYYNLQFDGQEDKLFAEVTDTIDLIIRFPEHWSRNTEHTRKAVLRKFPYNLIYSIQKDKIFILAVAHQNRKPEYWIDRLLQNK